MSNWPHSSVSWGLSRDIFYEKYIFDKDRHTHKPGYTLTKRLLGDWGLLYVGSAGHYCTLYESAISTTLPPANPSIYFLAVSSGGQL